MAGEIKKPAGTKQGEVRNRPNIPADSAEYKSEKQQALETVKKAADEKLKEAEERLLKSGTKMSPETRRALNDYFESSLDRADADNDRRISKDEVEKYTAAMLARADRVISDFAPDKQAEAQKGLEKAREAGKSVVESAASGVEKSASNLPSLEDLPKGKLNIAIDKLPAELERFGLFNQSLHKEIASSLKGIEKVQSEVIKYQEARSGIIDAVAYGYNLLFNGKKEDDELNKINRQVEKAKQELSEKKIKLEGKKRQLDEYGKQLGKVSNVEKARLIAEREAKKKEIANRTGKQDSDIEAKKKQYEALDKEQKKLEEAKKNLGLEAGSIKEKKAETADKIKTAERNKGAAENAGKAAAAELNALTMMLSAPGLSAAAKKEINQKLAEVKKRVNAAGAMVKQIDAGLKSGAQVKEGLDAKDKKVSQDTKAADAILRDQVNPGLSSLDKTINQLKEIKFNYVHSAESLTEAYNHKIEAVHKMDEQVDDMVLQSSIANGRAINSLGEGIKALDGMKVEKLSVIGAILHVGSNVWGGIFGGIAEGANWIGEKVIDLGKWVVDKTKESDNWYVKYLGGTAAHLFSFGTGAVGGAWELVGGLVTFVAHPLDTVKGMGGLIGRNPTTGEFSFGQFADSWTGLGKALISYEEWEKGYYGTAVGKIGITVASFFIGAGEVGAGLKGAQAATQVATRTASITGKAAIAANTAREAALIAARGAGKVGFWTGRAAATSAYISSIGVDIAKAAAALPKNIAVGSFDAVKGAGSAVLKAGREAGAALVEHPLASVGNAAKAVVTLPVKLAGQVIYGTAAVSKEILLLPFTAPGRILKRLNGAAKGGGAEVAAEVRAAAKVAENGAKYGEAQSKMMDLLKKDEQFNKTYGGKAAEMKWNEIGDTFKNKGVKLLNDADPNLAKAFFETREAVKTLEAETKKIAQEAQESIRKKLDDPACTPELRLELEQIEAEIERGLNLQKRFLDEYLAAGKSEELGIMERFYKGAETRTPADNLNYAIDGVNDYVAALKAGDEAGILRARMALGNPAKGTKLDLALEEIEGLVKNNQPLNLGDKFVEAFVENQKAVIESYERFVKAVETGQFSAYGPLIENSPWAEAMRQFVNRETYLMRNENISNAINGMQIRSELHDVIKPGMSPEQVAEAMNARFGKMKFSMEHVIKDELMIGDKAYTVVANETGKFTVIETSEFNAAAAAKSTVFESGDAIGGLHERVSKARKDLADLRKQYEAAQGAAKDELGQKINQASTEYRELMEEYKTELTRNLEFSKNNYAKVKQEIEALRDQIKTRGAKDTKDLQNLLSRQQELANKYGDEYMQVLRNVIDEKYGILERAQAELKNIPANQAHKFHALRSQFASEYTGLMDDYFAMAQARFESMANPGKASTEAFNKIKARYEKWRTTVDQKFEIGQAMKDLQEIESNLIVLEAGAAIPKAAVAAEAPVLVAEAESKANPEVFRARGEFSRAAKKVQYLEGLLAEENGWFRRMIGSIDENQIGKIQAEINTARQELYAARNRYIESLKNIGSDIDNPTMMQRLRNLGTRSLAFSLDAAGSAGNCIRAAMAIKNPISTIYRLVYSRHIPFSFGPGLVDQMAMFNTVSNLLERIGYLKNEIGALDKVEKVTAAQQAAKVENMTALNSALADLGVVTENISQKSGSLFDEILRKKDSIPAELFNEITKQQANIFSELGSVLKNKGKINFSAFDAMDAMKRMEMLKKQAQAFSKN